ncbi:MAG: biotin--[acetyl-CoA-carboxylase] ligase [Pseudomonadota bacterium]|jgi:BirA family biotin operon repressor/biotin-[acetyl-CoA-carboxylase] ligase|nr:MAG: biotin--[acetyl-CoA-carboxylase] ligase [Pseudomonadota bacterium]
MTLAMQVLQRLAAARAAEEGTPQFVSGAALAAEFAVTRSAIWKAMGLLRERGTEIEAITHRGYRLVRPASPLTAAGVLQRLSPGVRARLREGRCATEIASTNSELLERGAPPPGRFDFLTAEYQSAGRGRMGRSWLAPPGGAICMSWSWCFEGMGERPGALSLATGVAVRRALARLDVSGLGLKWPNDLVTPRGKLGGILIEMRSEAAGPLHVVVGLGLNVTLGDALRNFIGAAGGNQAADIAELVAPAAPPPREALVAAVLEENVALLAGFARNGFASLREEYLAADVLRDRPVQVLGGGANVAGGVARGVDADGALLVEHEGRLHAVVAGEVSVRPRQGE